MGCCSKKVVGGLLIGFGVGFLFFDGEGVIRDTLGTLFGNTIIQKGALVLMILAGFYLVFSGLQEVEKRKKIKIIANPKTRKKKK